MLHSNSGNNNIGSVQGSGRHYCSLLAVLCDDKVGDGLTEDRRKYPFPELASSGRLEVQTLSSPTVNEFRGALESFRPNFVYLQGQVLSNDEIGPLAWDGVDLSNAEVIPMLFDHVQPTMVYLEIPNGEELADAIHSKGVPYVMFWKNAFSCYAASHFRSALFSVLQSSPCHTWDAFQLAHASFRLYCTGNNLVLPRNSQKVTGTMGPSLLGEPPTIDVALPEVDDGDEEDDSGNDLSTVKIHDDDVSLKFLICGVSCSTDAYLLGCLEDGLNALVGIEMRGSKLQNRFSAPPPPLQAGAFSRGVVTMRCDLCTCSSSHISLLVSGSAQTCFDDQQLENHMKREAIERSQLVQAIPSSEEITVPSLEPRTSASIACGAKVFEACLKAPSWVLQVLRQLAPEVSYRSLAALGIASIQGLAVASFQKVDAERLLFFCMRPGVDSHLQNDALSSPPSWLRPPPPCRKSSESGQGSSPFSLNISPSENMVTVITADKKDSESGFLNGGLFKPIHPIRQKLKFASMRPLPHANYKKMIPFLGRVQADNHDNGQMKSNLPTVLATKHSVLATNVTAYKRPANAFQAKQMISLNPIPLKKHGCGRVPIHLCSEEDFLKDVMQFLILRGHTRLIPQGGVDEFPDAVLNSKRLDLYNLYREVVSRGGFHVGNGINWKGQVFSKMRNYTATHKMTGVGNTLKRHYETYLLEYELAHDDVDGECCLICHSSAAGDWVNCGICGEWAHFGCDRRQGLGAFKDYAKTDGLEYICPHCSVTNFRKKQHKPANGFLEGLTYSRAV